MVVVSSVISFGSGRSASATMAWNVVAMTTEICLQRFFRCSVKFVDCVDDDGFPGALREIFWLSSVFLAMSRLTVHFTCATKF